MAIHRTGYARFLQECWKEREKIKTVRFVRFFCDIIKMDIEKVTHKFHFKFLSESGLQQARILFAYENSKNRLCMPVMPAETWRGLQR